MQIREERLGAGRHARPHALLHPAEEEQAEEGDAGEAPGELWLVDNSGCSALIGQERKAAKTLSAILLVFILTWTPYNVLAVMKETHTSATQ